MKEILYLVLLVFLAMGVCTAQIPNLMGNWTGFEKGYDAENGSYKSVENDSINLSFVEQRDRVFTGNVSYMYKGKAIVEAFAGAINPDNKTFYLTQIDKGYSIGTIVSDNKIDLIYLAEGGEGAATFEEYRRIK
ncbi:MAG: hypothetical protein ACE14P_03425 [Methanotrichaceae archaeon]